MIAALFDSVASEWLKRKRSLTLPLVLGSAFFVPTIIFLSRFRALDALPALYTSPRFWEGLWRQAWESMALMILPMAIMLAVSLVAQLEYRNNAWKQLHATPQPLSRIFLAKLAVLVFLLLQLLVWFNLAIYLAGMMPAVIFRHVDAPSSRLPAAYFIKRNVAFLVDALPILALQYLLALRFKSFLTPLGVGMAMWILSIGTMGWKYNYLVPYSYAGIDYLLVEYQRKLTLPAAPATLAAGYFAAFTIGGYFFYAFKRDRG